MLKVAGNRIYPKEIVSQILTLEQIQEAEVVGIKTITGDTHLFAFVVTAPTVELTSQQIRRQLAALLPSYMVPREVTIVTSIPRTASGKPDYPALTHDAKQLLEKLSLLSRT
jgi:acyl-coenzyme A synthetase/AMP-(fatty) acid ligase